MTEPASTSPRAANGAGPTRLSTLSGETWYRTREGRRYGWELGLIIVVKLALLMLLWFVFIEPWPRPAVPPAAAVQQLYLPVLPAVSHD
jgi:hypothetical protein